MKYIELNWTKDWESKTVLLTIVQSAPDGVRYDEIKKRCRIIDALEKVEKDQLELMLEDADHEMLMSCVKSFKYGAATRQLLASLNAVMEAKNESHAARVPSPAPGPDSVPGGRIPDRAVAGGTGAEDGKLHTGSAQNGHLADNIPTDHYVER